MCGDGGGGGLEGWSMQHLYSSERVGLSVV